MGRRFDIPINARLIGAVDVLVTTAELRRFHEHIESHPLMTEIRQMDVDLAVVGACVCGGALDREDEYRRLLRNRDDLLAQCRKVSLAWYAELTKDEKPEPANDW